VTDLIAMGMSPLETLKQMADVNNYVLTDEDYAKVGVLADKIQDGDKQAIANTISAVIITGVTRKNGDATTASQSGGVGANSGRTSYRSADVVIPSENINLSGSYFKFTPNAMLGHEVTQVSNFLADIKRGIFTGVPSLPKGSLINGKSISSSDYPVIDGWYQPNIGGREVPISLKAITSDNPLSILQDVSKANKTGLNFGIKDVVMLVDAPNMNIDRLVKFASEGPLTGKALQQGVINRVVVKTPKGYVTINPGSTIRDLPKEW
jgi:hypothetical protein